MIPPLAKLDWIFLWSIFKPEILKITFTYLYYWWLVGLVVLTNYFYKLALVAGSQVPLSCELVNLTWWLMVGDANHQRLVDANNQPLAMLTRAGKIPRCVTVTVLER